MKTILKVLVLSFLILNFSKLLYAQQVFEQPPAEVLKELKDVSYQVLKEGIVPTPKKAISVLQYLDMVSKGIIKEDPELTKILTIKGGAELGVKSLIDAGIEVMIENMKEKGSIKPGGEIFENELVVKIWMQTVLKNAPFLDVKGQMIDMLFIIGESWQDTCNQFKQLGPLPPNPTPEQIDVYTLKYLIEGTWWMKTQALLIIARENILRILNISTQQAITDPLLSYAYAQSTKPFATEGKENIDSSKWKEYQQPSPYQITSKERPTSLSYSPYFLSYGPGYLLYDNFNDGVLNNTNWREHEVYPVGRTYFKEKNGVLNIDYPPMSSYAGVESHLLFLNDFEIVTQWKNWRYQGDTGPEKENWVQVWLEVRNEEATRPEPSEDRKGVYIFRGVSPWDNNYGGYVSNYFIGNTFGEESSWSSTEDTSGYFRITREGSIITTYYSTDGINWSKFLEEDITSEPMRFQLSAYTGDYTKEFHSEFDNVRVKTIGVIPGKALEWIDQAKLSQWTVQQLLTPVNLVFTQTFNGLITQIPNSSLPSTAAFSGNILGERIGVPEAMPGLFEGSFSGNTNIYNGNAANLQDSSLSGWSVGTSEVYAKGFKEGPLKGEMKSIVRIEENNNILVTSGAVTIQPDGKLSHSFTGEIRYDGQVVGEVSGNLNENLR